MLNGLEPIIIFSFFKKTTLSAAQLEALPLVSQVTEKFALPPVPIYLSDKLTGLYIESEDKSVDISTQNETLTNGQLIINQKGIGNVITINMIANKSSIGVALLSAIVDVGFVKVTSKEYSVSYLNGPITIINGLLHSFSMSQDANTDMLNIKIELSRGGDVSPSPVTVEPTPSAASLSSGGGITGGTTPSGSTFTTPPSGGTVLGTPP